MAAAAAAAASAVVMVVPPLVGDSFVPSTSPLKQRRFELDAFFSSFIMAKFSKMDNTPGLLLRRVDATVVSETLLYESD